MTLTATDRIHPMKPCRSHILGTSFTHVTFSHPLPHRGLHTLCVHSRAAILPFVSIPSTKPCWQTILVLLGQSTAANSTHFPTLTSCTGAFPTNTPHPSDCCTWPRIQQAEQLKNCSRSSLKSKSSTYCVIKFFQPGNCKKFVHAYSVFNQKFHECNSVHHKGIQHSLFQGANLQQINNKVEPCKRELVKKWTLSTSFIYRAVKTLHVYKNATLVQNIPWTSHNYRMREYSEDLNCLTVHGTKETFGLTQLSCSHKLILDKTKRHKTSEAQFASKMSEPSWQSISLTQYVLLTAHSVSSSFIFTVIWEKGKRHQVILKFIFKLQETDILSLPQKTLQCCQ